MEHYDTDPVELESLSAALVDGSSRAARSARARLQRRDRYGRFAEQGGGVRLLLRALDGLFDSVTGKIVGVSGTENIDILVEGSDLLPDGVYSVPSTSTEVVSAILPKSALDGVKRVRKNTADGPFIEYNEMLGVRVDADKYSAESELPELQPGDEEFLDQPGEQPAAEHSASENIRARNKEILAKVPEFGKVTQEFADRVNASGLLNWEVVTTEQHHERRRALVLKQLQEIKDYMDAGLEAYPEAHAAPNYQKSGQTIVGTAGTRFDRSIDPVALEYLRTHTAEETMQLAEQTAITVSKTRKKSARVWAHTSKLKSILENGYLPEANVMDETQEAREEMRFLGGNRGTYEVSLGLDPMSGVRPVYGFSDYGVYDEERQRRADKINAERGRVASDPKYMITDPGQTSDRRSYDVINDFQAGGFSGVYGDMEFILHDEVAERTAVHNKDSLLEPAWGAPAIGASDEAMIESLMGHTGFNGLSMVGAMVRTSINGDYHNWNRDTVTYDENGEAVNDSGTSLPSYVESNILGGFFADEVKAARFNGNAVYPEYKTRFNDDGEDPVELVRGLASQHLAVDQLIDAGFTQEEAEYAQIVIENWARQNNEIGRTASSIKASEIPSSLSTGFSDSVKTLDKLIVAAERKKLRKKIQEINPDIEVIFGSWNGLNTEDPLNYEGGKEGDDVEDVVAAQLRQSLLKEVKGSIDRGVTQELLQEPVPYERQKPAEIVVEELPEPEPELEQVPELEPEPELEPQPEESPKVKEIQEIVDEQSKSYADYDVFFTSPAALGVYISNSEKINGILRGNDDSDLVKGNQSDDLAVEEAYDYAQQLYRFAMQIPKTTRDQTVYRGVSGKYSEELRQLVVGDSFSENGFTSASLDIDIAQIFADDPDFDEQGTIIKINVPEGTPAVNVAAAEGSTSQYADELEVILLPGVKYTVTDIESDGTIVVSAEFTGESELPDYSYDLSTERGNRELKEDVTRSVADQVVSDLWNCGMTSATDGAPSKCDPVSADELVERVDSSIKKVLEQVEVKESQEAPAVDQVEIAKETRDEASIEIAAVLESSEKDTPVYWGGGSIRRSDGGNFIAENLDKSVIDALKDGSLKPPGIALPFFIPDPDKPLPEGWTSESELSGDGYLFTENGKRRWGLFGAAGLLLRRATSDGVPIYYLIKRSSNHSTAPGKYTFPGGAHATKKESDMATDPFEMDQYITAFREFSEETGLPLEDLNNSIVKKTAEFELDPGWKFTAYVGDSDFTLTKGLFFSTLNPEEAQDADWFSREQIVEMFSNGELDPDAGPTIMSLVDADATFMLPNSHGGLYETSDNPVERAKKSNVTGKEAFDEAKEFLRVSGLSLFNGESYATIEDQGLDAFNPVVSKVVDHLTNGEYTQALQLMLQAKFIADSAKRDAELSSDFDMEAIADSLSYMLDFSDVPIATSLPNMSSGELTVELRSKIGKKLLNLAGDYSKAKSLGFNREMRDTISELIISGKPFIDEPERLLKEFILPLKFGTSRREDFSFEGKIGPAGRPDVDAVRLPINESSFKSVPSVMTAIDRARVEKKDVSELVTSTLVDTTDVEDMKVEISTVKRPDEERKLRLDFKLTAWAGSRQAIKIEESMPRSSDAGWFGTREDSVFIGYEKYDENGDISPISSIDDYGREIAQEDVGSGYDYRYSDTNGLTIRHIRTVDPTFDGSPPIYDKYGDQNMPVAFHNNVTIELPIDATQADIERALALAGVTDVRSPSRADIDLLAENKLLSVFGKQNDPARPLKWQSDRDAILEEIERDWKVTPSSITPKIDSNGRLQFVLPEEVAERMKDFTDGKYMLHKLSLYSIVNGYLAKIGINKKIEDPEIPVATKFKYMAEALAEMFAGGSLLSTTARLSTGRGGVTGMSSTTDIRTGGADYVFLTPSTKRNYNDDSSEWSMGMTDSGLVTELEGELTWLAEDIYQRTDIYANYNDNYGQRKADSYLLDASRPGGYETMLKTSLSFDNLYRAAFSPTLRAMLIEELKKRGIDSFGDRPIEEVFDTKPGPSYNPPRLTGELPYGVSLEVQQTYSDEIEQLGAGVDMEEFIERLFPVYSLSKDVYLSSKGQPVKVFPHPPGSKVLGMINVERDLEEPNFKAGNTALVVKHPNGVVYIYKLGDTFYSAPIEAPKEIKDDELKSLAESFKSVTFSLYRPGQVYRYINDAGYVDSFAPVGISEEVARPMTPEELTKSAQTVLEDLISEKVSLSSAIYMLLALYNYPATTEVKEALKASMESAMRAAIRSGNIF